MEDNKLIAEFMGLTTDSVGWYLEKDLSKLGIRITSAENECTKHLCFHYSWDWLMPVVEKCFHTMGGNDINQVHHERIMDGLMEINITHTNERVVEFIKWYNENK